MCENTNTVSLPEALLDPRLSLDFLSEFWPLCNGKPAPLLAQANIYDTRCIEFLAAYYEVNIRNAELANARSSSAEPHETSAHLDRVAVALAKIDALEDRYISIGFFGEPLMEGVFYRDIHFTRPGLHGQGTNTISFSSHIAVFDFSDIPASEFEGIPSIIRFDDGKADS